MSDETSPVDLEADARIHDPANCAKVVPDLAGLTSFTTARTTAASTTRVRRRRSYADTSIPAFAYSTSAIRSGRGKSPITTRPAPRRQPGLQSRTAGGWIAGGPDWCAAQVHLDAEQGTLWTTCQDNGVLSSSSRTTRGRSRKPPRRRACRTTTKHIDVGGRACARQVASLARDPLRRVLCFVSSPTPPRNKRNGIALG